MILYAIDALFTFFTNQIYTKRHIFSKIVRGSVKALMKLPRFGTPKRLRTTDLNAIENFSAIR